MSSFSEQIVSHALIAVSVMWVIYTIFSSYGTTCFDMFKVYVTLIFLVLQLVWNNFIKGD